MVQELSKDEFNHSVGFCEVIMSKLDKESGLLNRIHLVL